MEAELETYITEHKKVEEVLSASELKYRRLFESAKDGILILDSETGKIEDVNPFLVKLLGYSRDQFISKAIWDIGFFKDIIANQTNFLELQEKKYVRYENLPLETTDGRKIDVEFVSNVYQEDHHNVIQCNIRDITERKRIEDRLRQSEERFQNLFTSMDEGFALCEMIYDQAGKPVDFRHIEVNPSFGRITGLPLERVVGRTAKEIFPGLEPFWIETYGRIVACGCPERIDNPIADLGKHIEVHAWRSAPGRFAAVFNDITDRIKAENLLRIHSNGLVLANKELEAFSYSVSHDLRNPLNSIVTCVAVLKKDLETMGKDSKEAIGHIENTTQRMSHVITDLLSLSGIARQEVHRETVNLSDLVQSFCTELKSSTNPHREIDFVITPDCIVNADAGLVKILIENLVRNAWKYTSKTNQAHIEFGLQRDNSQTIYFIKDNGVGFDMIDVEKIFNPFIRLHSQKDFKGTGIGLAIAKRIIEKHHGAIWAEAEKDKGATFYFRLE